MPCAALAMPCAAIDRAPPSLLPPPTSGMMDNYLMGSVPALAAGLRVLDVGYNFLTDGPAITYTFCGSVNNCLKTPSKCPNSVAGTAQKPAASCAFCGTTNGMGPYCTGTGAMCMANASAVVATGTVNSLSQPLLPFTCVGGTAVTMTAAEAAAMLSIKSALGLTFTTWATTNPCQLSGAAATSGLWDTLSCNSNGNVIQIYLRDLDITRKSFPTDISKLTALTNLVFMQYMDGDLGKYLSVFSSLTTLKGISLQYNWFTDTFPSVIASVLSLTEL
ncbi:unnamed protein product [Closterium sp. NIES-65]|nr:unnamed protein product [Closterium sp. NIES-65]